ncbi:MAG: BRCT domain-containing protein, partial [Bacteroidota bacterium]
NHKLKFSIEEKSEGGKGILSGKSFVVSGIFKDYSRDGIKQVIEENGGKVVSGISSKTDYMVAGDESGPSKLEKATALGVRIISENEFKEMLKHD